MLISTRCKLSGRIIVLNVNVFGKQVVPVEYGRKKNLNKRNLEFHRLQADSIKQHRTLSSKGCPQAIICRSFTCCWTDASVKTKLSKCVYVYICVHNSHLYTWEFSLKLPTFGSGKPPKSTNSFNHLKTEIAAEAFDSY